MWLRKLVALLEPLRWAKHRYERQLQHQREEREAQLRLIETLFDNFRAIDQQRSEDLRLLAHGVTEQAKGFQEWLRLFNQPAREPQSHVVREVDEWEAEQERLREAFEALNGLGYPIAGNPLEQLKFIIEDRPGERTSPGLNDDLLAR